MLKAGAAAPEFELRDQNDKTWKLSDLRGERIILYFYPVDDTPGCTRESCDFRDAHADFDRSGYLILGISSQGAESHRAFAEKYDLDFPLLIDEDIEVATAYETLAPEGLDWDGIPIRVIRSTFVIDENGRIERAEYGVSSKGHVASLRETLGVGSEQTAASN
jgi:peroxiredoxin Q/BCP